LLHGVSLPVADVVDEATLDIWVAAGLSAVRVIVPVAVDGSFPGTAGADPAPGGTQPGLEELAVAVRAYTDRNLRVVVRLAPARENTVLTAAAALAAVERVATASRDVAGLVGFEIAVPATVDQVALADAVRRNDPYHLLWREVPASIDADATVAANGDAAYLVTWGDETLQTARRLYPATEAANLGWFYDYPAIGEVVAEVVRPYPVAVAGTPTEFLAKRDGAFSLTYSTTPPSGAALVPGTASAVVLPASVYPNGYAATVVGGQVTSDRGAPVLCVVADAGATSVAVSVAPVAAGTAAAVPVRASRTASTCEAPPPVAAPGTATLAAGEGTARAAPVPAEGDDVALLVLFPLIGAVSAALVLGAVMWVVRSRRAPGDPRSGG
jgi:hypothetical protein